MPINQRNTSFEYHFVKIGDKRKKSSKALSDLSLGKKLLRTKEGPSWLEVIFCFFSVGLDRVLCVVCVVVFFTTFFFLLLLLLFYDVRVFCVVCVSFFLWDSNFLSVQINEEWDSNTVLLMSTAAESILKLPTVNQRKLFLFCFALLCGATQRR